MTDLANAHGRLLSFIHRIERLQEEIKQLQADVTDVKKEAKAAGFDPKVINQMVRERRMSEADRQEWQALCETYRAALGMLDGTPLGDMARKRFMEPPPAGAPGASGDRGTRSPESPDDAADGPDNGVGTPPSAELQPSADDINAARAQGGADARGGVAVTQNPYPFGDARRAAWDEGWCLEAGSDGMDLPQAWRRTKPAKGPSAGKGDSQGAPA